MQVPTGANLLVLTGVLRIADGLHWTAPGRRLKLETRLHIFSTNLTTALHLYAPLCIALHCTCIRILKLDLNSKQTSVNNMSSEVTEYLFLAGHPTEGLLHHRDDENLYSQPRLHALCKLKRGRSVKRQLSWKADSSVVPVSWGCQGRGIWVIMFHIGERCHELLGIGPKTFTDMADT